MNQTKYSQEQLFELSKKLVNRSDELFNIFGIELVKESKMWVGQCPIHDSSDNPTAFNLYHREHCGNWICRTRQCHKSFQNGMSMLSFLRALLSKQNGWKSAKDRDKVESFYKTIKFAEDFLGNKTENIKIDKTNVEKKKFASIFSNTERKRGRLTRKQIRSKLVIPAQYYLKRNYSPEVLDKYDVGLCTDDKKPLYNRIVVPIYDDDYFYVGCTSRSVFDKCSKCGYYHNAEMVCPSVQYRGMYTKWRHTNFDSNKYLYNYWKAKNSILETQIAIITESPGNVWRLEESGIQNSVGIFGTVLGDYQKEILDKSGAINLLLIMDNDKNGAGHKAIEEIKERLKKLYNIVVYVPPLNDVGDMTKEQIQNEVLPVLEKF